MQTLLSVENLTVRFDTPSGMVNALDNISFSIPKGACVALVGESGSGKSITGLAIMRLLNPDVAISNGVVLLDGTDLMKSSAKAMQGVRGKRIAMIFQNAKSSLNPIRRIGDVLVDILRTHGGRAMTRNAARERAISLLSQIGFAEPERRMSAYPSELSGGMCQRIMIAAAFACDPELIIADEPTSALDVTTQRLVMDLLMSSCRERGVSAIFISHDLALASEYCDRAIVMHAGQILEQGPAENLFLAPAHPYTRMLMDSMPYGKDDVSQLQAMGGMLPDLRRTDLPCCRFSERCLRAQNVCREAPLPSQTVGNDHLVRCHFPNET